MLMRSSDRRRDTNNWQPYSTLWRRYPNLNIRTINDNDEYYFINTPNYIYIYIYIYILSTTDILFCCITTLQ